MQYFSRRSSLLIVGISYTEGRVTRGNLYLNRCITINPIIAPTPVVSAGTRGAHKKWTGTHIFCCAFPPSYLCCSGTLIHFTTEATEITEETCHRHVSTIEKFPILFSPESYHINGRMSRIIFIFVCRQYSLFLYLTKEYHF